MGCLAGLLVILALPLLILQLLKGKDRNPLQLRVAGLLIVAAVAIVVLNNMEIM